jgi:hypothetical protein
MASHLIPDNSFDCLSEDPAVPWATTTIKTPSGEKLLCAIKATGDYSFITRKTLKQYFPEPRMKSHILGTAFYPPSRYLKKAQNSSAEIVYLELELENGNGATKTIGLNFRVCEEEDELLKGI